MNMKPLKVALPSDLRDRLERSAAEHGHSLGLEIRERIEQSFGWEQFDPQTHLLLLLIGRLAFLTKPQTGHAWHEHPGAAKVFQQAVVSLLARWRPKGDPVLDPATLPPNRPVALDDIEGMGIALEAIVSFDRPLTGDEQRGIYERLHKDDAHWWALLQPLMEGTRPLPPSSRSRLRKPKGE
jgi:hypothetical protein